MGWMSHGRPITGGVMGAAGWAGGRTRKALCPGLGAKGSGLLAHRVKEQ